MRKMLTISTAVALCDGKYSDSYLRRQCRTKRIKGARLVGKTWQFSEQAFRNWLENDTFHKHAGQDE